MQPQQSILAILSLLALATSPVPARAESGGAPPTHAPAVGPAATIGAALRAARRAPDAPVRPFAERIAGAAPGLLEAALDVLIEERVPAVEPDDAFQILSGPQRAILLSALARWPRAEVRASLAARLESAAEGDARVSLAAVRLLGAVGGAADLQRIVALAPRKPGEPEALTRPAREALREATAAILARDPRAWERAGDIVRTADRAAAKCVVEAVAVDRDPRALRVLAEAARVQRDLAPLCVAGAQRVGPSMDADVVLGFVEWMTGELALARPEYRRSLYQAIGTLDDGSHAELLIDGLADEDQGVRESALWGLRKISGYGFSATPDPWIAWLAQELRWNEVERPRLRTQLAAREPERVAAALRGYAGRRVWRESLAEDVAIVLERSEPALQLLACEVLESLRALSAVRPMAALLSAPEEGVRDAAWRALGTISGLDLPRDPEAAIERLLLL
ncbi:MAG: hypothetical protein JNK02_10670 [Planctomycetes bacterium]|nr:hypothetical protein [Planctomycetota bacterium]